jgi:ribulose-phosphate 3-epimerase
MNIVAPSLLAADFSKLGSQIVEADRAGCHRFHFDVMDGHFVPNLTMGPMILASIRSLTKLPIEVHLMVDNPGKFAEAFARAGADRLIFHLEVLPDPRPLLHIIRNLGKLPAIAVNPETPIEAIAPYLKEIDLALCMTVHPGFGGQKYLPESDQRIRRLRQLIATAEASCQLEVDGGIDHATARSALDAGANVLVIGTSIFHHPQGITAAVHEFREIAGCEP